MRGFGAIFARELASLFRGPLVWILLAVSLLFQGYFLNLYLDLKGGAVDEAFELQLGGGVPFWLLLVVLPAILTMRTLAEEARTGILEFLLTAPVSDSAVVLGKAAAAGTAVAVVQAGVVLQALVLAALGASPDWGQVLTGVSGGVLVGFMFTAIGVLCSALSSTPALSAFAALLACTALLFVSSLGRALRGLPEGLVEGFLGRVDPVAAFQGSFQTGVFDTGHVIFFLVWTCLFLFLAVRALGARRWLG